MILLENFMTVKDEFGNLMIFSHSRFQRDLRGFSGTSEVSAGPPRFQRDLRGFSGTSEVSETSEVFFPIPGDRKI